MNQTLIAVRRATGLSQTKMARYLMLSREIYAAYEHGRRRISEPERVYGALIRKLREHQAHCELLKLSIASVKCTNNGTNGGV